MICWKKIWGSDTSRIIPEWELRGSSEVQVVNSPLGGRKIMLQWIEVANKTISAKRIDFKGQAMHLVAACRKHVTRPVMVHCSERVLAMKLLQAESCCGETTPYQQ